MQRQEQAAEADAAWRKELLERRPVLGRVRTAFVPKPVVGVESGSTSAWKVGAAGEERVAEILAGCEGVLALHDRGIPGSRANIDHIAVAPSGVFVVDAKKYTGEVELRDRGGVFRSDVYLYVGGRDRTKLTDGVLDQMKVVRDVLAAAGHADAPVRGVLCFVGANWPLMFRRPVRVNGVVSVWPLGLPGVLQPKKAPTHWPVEALAAALSAALRPA